MRTGEDDSDTVVKIYSQGFQLTVFFPVSSVFEVGRNGGDRQTLGLLIYFLVKLISCIGEKLHFGGLRNVSLREKKTFMYN